MGASCGYSCLIREGLAHVECMVDGSSWSPLLDGGVGGILGVGWIDHHSYYSYYSLS
jgi:hypothetical protein